MQDYVEAFLSAHPAHDGNKTARFFKSWKYRKTLPEALLSLWKKHGFGFYGKRYLAIIDPDEWQSTLDRWIISQPDDVKRIPVMLTPTGGLIYYRKLEGDAEDYAIIDPNTRQTQILAYNTETFFGDILTDKEVLQDLAPLSLILHGEDSEGALENGEVYCVDQTMFAMQMLKVTRENALAMHKQLRDEVDSEATAHATVKNGSIGAMMPEDYYPLFEQYDTHDDGGIYGLYLSRYIDWSRMLALSEDGIYQLLFWRNDHRTGAVSEVRFYDGGYDTEELAQGDIRICLDIELNEDSLGSDANDEVLHIRMTADKKILFPEVELDSVANAIGRDGTLGEGRDYFLKVSLEDILNEDDFEDLKAPEAENLPKALTSLVNYTPIAAKIIDIRENDDGSFWVTVDKGTDDGLRHNMGLYSPLDADHELKGWVWGVDPKNCGLGLSDQVESTENKRVKPEIGDILVTKM